MTRNPEFQNHFGQHVEEMKRRWTLALDGAMLDLPHLVQAKKILSMEQGD